MTARCAVVLILAAACGDAPRSVAVSRVWPVLGTMMSAAAWGADTARIGRALDAVRDSADRPLGSPAGFDSLEREIRPRTRVTLAAADVTTGAALDRAALVLTAVVDSALLDIGGQFLWIGSRGTRRVVGIADPANSLDALATVELQGGSVSTSSSVTVLAPSGLAAEAWSTALSRVGCDSALALAARPEKRRVSVVCADSTGVRWTPDLDGRVLVPRSNGSRRPRVP